MNKERFKEGNYGYTSLTELVNSFMNDSFNDGRKYMTHILRIAADAWNKFYYITMKIAKNKVLEINKSNNTVDIPVDFAGLAKVFVVDECNRLQQLFYDDNLNVIDMVIKPNKGCGCTQCKCDNDVCAASAQVSFIEETIIINNQDYKQITQRKLCKNGDIIEEVAGYIAKGDPADPGTFTVVPHTERRFISKVDVKPCGCVINVPKNNDRVIDDCRCVVICAFVHNTKNQIPVAINKHGHYKLDLERGVIHLIGVKQKKVILSYQSNTKSEEEIMVPDFAIDYLKTAIKFRSIHFRENVSPGQIVFWRQEMEREEMELITYLNPIDMVEWNHFKSSYFPKL